MKIEIDRDLCQAHGVCCSEAPDLFRLDADGKLEVLNENPDEAQRAALEKAAKYCPTYAIRIVE
jgi:ferredoxin